jgi:hypothetical protein
VRHSPVHHLAAPLYVLAGFVLIMAPSVALWLAAAQGGLGRADYADLVLGSLLVATVHGILAWERLQGERQRAGDRRNMWIAAANALVVLALSSTLLLVLVLHSFPDEHASLADRGVSVTPVWLVVQLAAAALAEGTGRFLFRWLEAGEAALPTPAPGDAAGQVEPKVPPVTAGR